MNYFNNTYTCYGQPSHQICTSWTISLLSWVMARHSTDRRTGCNADSYTGQIPLQRHDATCLRHNEPSRHHGMSRWSRYCEFPVTSRQVGHNLDKSVTSRRLPRNKCHRAVTGKSLLWNLDL